MDGRHGVTLRKFHVCAIAQPGELPTLCARLIMNSKPDTAPRFAVNRADMLSRLPGVQLPASSKRFARGKPKLHLNEPIHGAVPMHESSFPARFGVRRAN
jgi:hypothetical protein